jgi:hypothetical protein
MKIDYSTFPALYAAARRERAKEIQRLIIAPLAAFFKQPRRRHSRMIRRSAFG